MEHCCVNVDIDLELDLALSLSMIKLVRSEVKDHLIDLRMEFVR